MEGMMRHDGCPLVESVTVQMTAVRDDSAEKPSMAIT